MAAIGGVAVDGRRVARVDLSPVQAVLTPHGRSEEWHGEIGRSRVGLCAHTSGETAAATADGGRIVVYADARLTDRAALMGRLRRTAGAPDAELIAHAYLRWGDQVVDHLDGSYAFVVADARRAGILLVRSHDGSRPLVLHERDGVTAFASTALALTGLPGVGHELDLERVAEVLLLAYSSERTFVRNVRWVPPGTATWIGDDQRRAWRWWRPEEFTVSDLGSLDAHATQLRDELEASVARCLERARRPGVMLSGGLDSASIAAVAASQLAPVPLRTYTSVPPSGWRGAVVPGWVPDERFAVEALVAGHRNLRPTYFSLGATSLFDLHEATWELGAGPSRNPVNMMWILGLRREAAADGVDVLLSGGAGNIAFSADGPNWLLDLLRGRHPVIAIRERRAWSRRTGARAWAVWRNALAPLEPPAMRRARRRSMPTPLDEWLAITAINPDVVDDLDPHDLLPRLGEHRVAWTRDTRDMFGVAATQSDGHLASEALFGVAAADPTADRRLLELALAQPERWRRHDGRSRAICRRAMTDVLPSEIVDRETRGAQAPEWFDVLTAQRHDIAEELDAARDHPTSRQMLDIPRLERLVASWPDRCAEHDSAVTRNYRLALTRALLVSKYTRWFEERGRRVASGGPVVALPAET